MAKKTYQFRIGNASDCKVYDIKTDEKANSITEDENSFYIMVITTIPEIHVNNHFTRKINETHFAFCVSHFAK